MLLLANGCSHTAGAEIEYEWQDNCYEKAYPSICSKELGWDTVNLAVSGASQERIIRTTVDWVGTNYKYHKNTELYVIIMWSGPARTEFFSEKINDFLQISSPSNDECYKQQFTHAEYLYFKSYIAIQNRSAHIIKWYNNIILLQNYLLSMKIRYLFLNSSEALPYHHSPINLKRQIYFKNYPSAYFKQNCFTELLANRGYEKPEHITRDTGHYGEDAHIFYGKNIAKYIKETVNGSI